MNGANNSHPMDKYPPRPVPDDKQILETATLFLASPEWYEPKLNEDEIKKGAFILTHKVSRHADGYECAKAFEDDGFDVDLNFAQSLDGWSGAYRSLCRRLERDWEQFNNIEPPYPVGTYVKTSTFHSHAGTITGVSKYSPATYEIKEDGCTCR